MIKNMLKAILYSFFLIVTGLFSSSPSKAYTLNAYDFKFKDIEGNELKMSDFKRKVVLITNVASKCGFTKQYTGLQALWDKYQSKDFILLGIPQMIFTKNINLKKVKNFCELTFGVNFPMTSITKVRGKDAHPFYAWAKTSYGNKTIPKWNFYKLLINKDGKIVGTYSSMVSPTSDELVNDIEKYLN